MVSRGGLVEGIGIPVPADVSWLRLIRAAWLQAEKERQAEIRASRDEPRPLRIPLGYRGTATAKTISFMTRDSFVIEVPRDACREHDSTRLLLHPTEDGRTVFDQCQAALADEAKRRLDFPGVDRSKPDRIRIALKSGFQPEVGRRALDLVMRLRAAGVTLRAGMNVLVIDHADIELDDGTLSDLFGLADRIKSTVPPLRRSRRDGLSEP